MNFGVYSRKSKFTGKGESVENQVQLCKAYIERCYGDLSQHRVEVFEDEGFSGKNLARPEFQRMLSLAHRKSFDCIVCYRLDRISRNVSDFSTLIEDFDRHKIAFVCIREQFDTSTPMGRAMMYIASVFAQLERETIAERIRDNMLLLARTGRWLGGTTPLGFQSAKVTKEWVDGKEKTSYMLSPLEGEQDLVRLVFQKFLELKSLTQVETFLLQRGAKTRRGKPFTVVALRELLTNPTYCVADEAAYTYFLAAGADVCAEREDFQGDWGISAYNRTTSEGKRQTKNPVEQWIVGTGRHQGIVNSGDWILTQKILKSNQPSKAAKQVKNPVALLSGLLVCQACGSFMRPRVNSNKRRDAQGNQTFAYLCELKKKSKGDGCQMASISGNQLDQLVCQEVLGFDLPGAVVRTKLEGLRRQFTRRSSPDRTALDAVRCQMEEKRRQIDELLSILARAANTPGKLYDYTAQKIDELDGELETLGREARGLEQAAMARAASAQGDSLFADLASFSSCFYQSSAQEKRLFLRSVIQQIVWDGKEVHLVLWGEP